MKLTFHGATRTVTGSKHLIEVNGTRILLDCGLFQGQRRDTFERNVNFAFDPASIDVVILSHAHIDHSGNLPNLVKRGFKGDIICTPATRDLCASMLPDSGHIQEKDVEFVNKRHKKQGKAPVEPIYTQQDAYDCMDAFTTRAYHRARSVAPGVTLTFQDAGHMLGSTIVVLDIEDSDAHRDVRLVFSGDLGHKGIPIIRDPETVSEADILIMESTYGNRLHEPFEDSAKRLETIINETYKRGGSIVMPSFAVGRAQQIVFTLHQLVVKGDIPHLPIFVDSPLAVDATAVFQLHPECFDDEIRAFLTETSTRNPFGFDDLTYIRRVEESKQLNFMREPCIIISASGMAEFGRVLHHLKNRIENPNTTVLITGWQAPNTLGRRLVDGEKIVHIFGEEYHNNARVEVLNGFSGHADRSELLEWAGAFTRKPTRTFLVHGEIDAATPLGEALTQQYGHNVAIPDTAQSFDL